MGNEMEHKKGEVLYYPISDFKGQYKKENGEYIKLDKMQVDDLLKEAFPKKDITVNADEDDIISIKISNMETIVNKGAIIYTEADANGDFEAIYLRDWKAFIILIKP